jgi:hypothetical protein
MPDEPVIFECSRSSAPIAFDKEDQSSLGLTFARPAFTTALASGFVDLPFRFMNRHSCTNRIIENGGPVYETGPAEKLQSLFARRLFDGLNNVRRRYRLRGLDRGETPT